MSVRELAAMGLTDEAIFAEHAAYYPAPAVMPHPHGDLDSPEAQRLRQEAETMLRDANAQREAAVADAQRLLTGANAEAARLAAAAAAEAEASAKRREQMAIDRINAAEKSAVDEVRMIAAEIATTAARDVITTDLTAGAASALVDRAITGLPAALAPRRAA